MSSPRCPIVGRVLPEISSSTGIAEPGKRVGRPHCVHRRGQHPMTDSFPAPSCSSPHAAQADSATPGVSEVCTSAAARAGPLSASHHSLWIQKSFVSIRSHRQHWHRHTVCLGSRHKNHFTNPRSLRIIHDDNIRLISRHISDYRLLTQFFVCQSQLSHMQKEIFENQQKSRLSQ